MQNILRPFVKLVKTKKYELLTQQTFVTIG